MKKSLLKMTLAVLMMAGGFMSLNAQQVSTGTVGVTARLSKQMVVSKLTDVDFGGIFIPRTGTATATMDHSGVVAISAGTTALYSTSLQHNGMIRVDADANTTFTVTYPATVSLNGMLGGSLVYTPALYTYQGVAAPSSSVTTYSMLGSNDANDGTINKMFKVAGSVDVPSTAVSDTYIGNFDVTYTWQ